MLPLSAEMIWDEIGEKFELELFQIYILFIVWMLSQPRGHNMYISGETKKDENSF